jgi:hypothetical protein
MHANHSRDLKNILNLVLNLDLFQHIQCNCFEMLRELYLELEGLQLELQMTLSRTEVPTKKLGAGNSAIEEAESDRFL